MRGKRFQLFWFVVVAMALASAASAGAGEGETTVEPESQQAVETGEEPAAGTPEEQAVAAARAWLELVDGGEYDESWQEAADYFRNAVTREQWRQSLEAVRKPLGGLVSRRVKSGQHATSLPGAPDGEYVVIQFSTSFENKGEAIETVTPMRQPDGRWRVSGYYIR